jgi:prolyl oligopeptidase
VSDTVFLRYEGFLSPPALYEVNVRTLSADLRQSTKSHFDSTKYMVEQLEATSADGTGIPYFVVRPRDSLPNSNTPALLYGYGGYGRALYPVYDGSMGRLWLEKGGIYALANVRGGGEFGRTWHVQRAQRQHTYNDFEAIARDLVKRKYTSPKRLGIEGHSIGGLLVGVMITQHPDLFAAAILAAPLLDQFRLDETYAGKQLGAREHGSMDVPEERLFLERTSPFQNLRSHPSFPKPLILASATDDTVEPVQSRRFAAKMETMSLPFYFVETSDGGHGIAVAPEEKARLTAIKYVYLSRQLTK